MTEIGAHAKLLEIISRDYNTYSGFILEKYFVDRIIEREEYTRIGYWHDNHGNNEIDIIGIDELNQKIDFYEVKRQSKAISIGALKGKAESFLNQQKQLSRYTCKYIGLSLEDM